MPGITSVTQATDKSTGVTINKMDGVITMNAAALAAGAEATFTVTNSRMRSEDVVIVNHKSGGTLGAYAAFANTNADGSFKITVTNLSAGSLSEAIVLQYQIERSGYT